MRSDINFLFLLVALLFVAPLCLQGEELAKDSEAGDVSPDTLSPATRQRPGGEPVVIDFPKLIYESVPDIESSASDFVPVPDRWRQFYVGKWYDPYNQNVLKGDIPIFGEPGHEWFFEAEIISETSFERSKIALPVGIQSTAGSGRLDILGNGLVSATTQNVVGSFSLIKGNTTYKPPDFELRVAPVFTFTYLEAAENGVLNIDPADGGSRDDTHIGFLELFADIHLADLSKRYDFVSSRIGIQQFQSDFRGFVYSDSAPGARLFGNYDSNLWQGNLAWFSRLEKDTNSGQNSMFDDRHEDVLIANIFRQDAFVLGYQLSASVLYREDKAGDEGFFFDDNGFLRRPASIGDERSKNIRSTYLGLAGDGHIDRWNMTSALYVVSGSESHNPISGRRQDVLAGMVAQELSYDFDWLRLRASILWASGDSDPFDGDATGFDAIFDVPNFAGGDLSYWQRQALPLVGGGEVFLVNRNSLFANLRAGKEHGQSNYVNPGIRLYNLGVDIEVLPELKLVTNATYLQFDRTETIEVLRQDGSISRDIGFDLSAGLIYRPFLNNNVEVRAGAAALFPDDGIENLYGDQTLYHFFTDVIFEY